MKYSKTLPDKGDNKAYAKAKDSVTVHFEPANNPILTIQPEFSQLIGVF